MSDMQKILDQLLQLIDLTEAKEIDCDEFLNRSSSFVERVSSGEKAPAGWECIVQHLQVCPECEEEMQALRQALERE